ncbi:dihydropyrimidinase [Tindallia magadiensis]|uniref:D-hydantoinase n=1 Tax=Tindallia magadiensis TaxID=69895 RepID=A0A1I3CB37_9FIRM|nr:dihydropyrimidinase [Tindallia magadiensis]SFH71687.1 dihydropyrimidinase [Tindallia magadiensis]
MDLIIKNGTIVTAKDTYAADVGIKDGKVVLIGNDLRHSEAETIDASGKLILPGAIDANTHLGMPLNNTQSADDCASGTYAAACGGTTTIFDYVIQQPGESMMETIRKRSELFEKESYIDYSFNVSLTKVTPEILKEFKEAVDFGINQFKVFMIYSKEHLMTDDGTFVKAMLLAKELGARMAVHAENPYIINMHTEEFLAEGKGHPWYHYQSRQEYVETEAVKRAVYWATSFNTPLYIPHLACKEGLDEISRARNEGYDILAETCPHYLYFTNEVYKYEGSQNYVCSPPIKGPESQDALWDGIKRGDISIVATDHCPFQSHEKAAGLEDYTKIPNGVMGIENMYPYMLSEANKGRLSFNKVVEVCSSNPAHLFGCAPQKGTIAIGSDADLVVYDPEKTFVVKPEKMHSNVDHTIWDGVEFSGYPIKTFSRGKLIYDNEKFVGEKGWGQFLKREPLS